MRKNARNKVEIDGKVWYATRHGVINDKRTDR